MKIDLSCPAEVWRCVLIDPEGTGAEVTLFNLSDKTVTSTEVTLVLHSREDDETSRVLFRAHALRARSREAYVFVVPLPESEGKVAPYKVEVFIEKIWYEDATVWRRGRSPMTEYRSNVLSMGRDLEMLRFVAGPHAVGFPEEQENVWVCVCGRPNLPGSTVCAHCLKQKDEVFRLYNREAVEQVVNAHQQNLETHARATREETSRLQAAREEEQRQKDLKHRRRVRWTVAVAVLLVLAYGLIFQLLPYLRYRNALNLLQKGQYAEAMEALEEMPGYLDADNQLLRATYEEGKRLLNEGSMESLKKARETFEGLGMYLDSSTLCKQADYASAKLMLDDGLLDEAAELFSSLGSYLDSADMVTQCNYQKAIALFSSGRYAAAASAFDALGSFEESESYATRSRLMAAREALENDDPDTAIQLLSLISSADETSDLLRQAHYLKGQQLYALVQGVSGEHLTDLRIHALGHQHLVLLLAGRHRHHHSLSSSRAAVVHRSVGDVHARQLSHHRLVLKDIVQRAL